MQGLLLLNLGTPDDPQVPAVRRYLRQFLSDPRVIDIHPIARWLLLNLVILPFRPAKSAEAYRTIWTERGSPLLFYTRDLAERVQHELGAGWRVAVGMRYGRPAADQALAELHLAGCSPIHVLPLYPQYASASTGTALEQIYAAAARYPVTPVLRVLPDFYQDPRFIEPAAALARPVVPHADHVLFSFHGLPERQVKASDFSGSYCLATAACCDQLGLANRSCYRAQCFATARALARTLDLPPERTSVAFQSRLGRTPWIRPYTDEVIPELARRGVRRLAVLCPSFTADCLETIEEIGARGVEQFRQAGGEHLDLVPCVNADPAWARGVADMARGVSTV
jgi:ferrochelatase